MSYTNLVPTGLASQHVAMLKCPRTVQKCRPDVQTPTDPSRNVQIHTDPSGSLRILLGHPGDSAGPCWSILEHLETFNDPGTT